MTKAELTYLFDMLTLVIEGYGNEVVVSRYDGKPTGLCGLVPNSDASAQWDDWVRVWVGYSGNIGFPVPCGGTGASSAFYLALADGQLYNTDTEYGRARIRLAEHLRKCVIKELEK